MGFAEGFRSGFGLISDVKDRELKRDQIEADQEYKRQQASDLKAYREEDLKIKRASQQSDSLLAGLRAQTAQKQAENAGISGQAALLNAQTSKINAKNATNPESIDYKKGLSEIAENEAQTEKYESDTNRINNQENRFNAAVNVSSIYDMASNADGIYGNAQLDRVAEMYQQNKNSGFFNLGTVASDVHMRGTQEIQGFLADVAQGRDPEMSDNVLRAFTTALALDSSAAVGRELDSSFVNAPDAMRNSGYEVVSQGLFSANVSGSNGEVNGQLFVEVQNRDDPSDVQFYFPPLTESRSNISSQNLNLTLDEVSQAAAGSAYFIQNVGPSIKPLVKQARIKAKFGNSQGDNGVEKFEARVQGILESNRKAIQNGSNTSSLIGGSPEFAELNREQQLSEQQMSNMKRRIEEQILFGAEEKPTQTRAKEWLQETYTALLSAPTPEGKSTLNNLIPEEQWSPQLISALAPYYDKDDEGRVIIKDPVALAAELARKGYITK
jgi:hypothetical protein